MTLPLTTYKPGTPIWVDLGSKDPTAATAFYTQLFGWEAEVLGAEAGGYVFLRKDGKLVAGLGGLMSDQQPTAWNTYLYVTDADAAVQAVVAAGGQVIAPPFDVLESGRMAVFMDSAGAAISVWQPKQMWGGEIFNVPGALCWNELNSRDLEASKSFYSKAFGLGVNAHPMGPGMGEYVEWQAEGRTVARAMGMPPGVPAQVPSFWLVYFAVADIDATIARVTELGGTVSMGRADSPQGPLAVFMDPQGGSFAAIQMNA